MLLGSIFTFNKYLDRHPIIFYSNVIYRMSNKLHWQLLSHLMSLKVIEAQYDCADLISGHPE